MIFLRCDGRVQVILVDANGFLSIYAFDRADIICTKRLGQEPILGITRREGTSQYAILFTVRPKRE
jgi:hypothetical protein